jgi:hypothetical protein
MERIVESISAKYALAAGPPRNDTILRSAQDDRKRQDDKGRRH